ncbi:MULTISPECIES: SDR family NAD(P)-dependent oxidoreductase [Marinovum]|uniref:SDR family NAD(P)-dependent oxidoreductase n=1 Tax=Marinovum TaxID=367771 RepID=UPI00237AEDF3|nr:glucose 1-dehydrogenase [Marinovum sp. PR37]MDD9746415.1 glucose 1-dehydrogenase [Marinovum sp. PR37]
MDTVSQRRGIAGKVVLVTGGGQGIGAAIVRRFHAEGALVCISDIHIGPAEVLAEELNATEGRPRAQVVRLDVTRAKEWDRVVTQLTEDHGGVDILINNAGILDPVPLDEIDENAWDLTMAVNAKGPFLGAQKVLSAMRQRGGGAIVNVSSMAGIIGGRAAHYVSSKGAVRMLTKSVALVGAAANIRCNSVHPGMVETAMAQAAVARPGAREARLARLPLNRFGEPSEIANVVVFLASSEASFMTGAEVCVDGGGAIV